MHRKASAKNSGKLNKFLHSEMNLLIQHIIVQDPDGQNNNSPLRVRACQLLAGPMFTSQRTEMNHLTSLEMTCGRHEESSGRC